MIDTKMTAREGPKVTVRLSCDGCAFLFAEHHRVEGNGGDLVVSAKCLHGGAARGICVAEPDVCTPRWCPLIGKHAIDPSHVDWQGK